VTAPAGDASALRRAIERLHAGSEQAEMGLRARSLAEATFDRTQTVRAVGDYLETIVDGSAHASHPHT
jgi:hypothetical protein